MRSRVVFAKGLVLSLACVVSVARADVVVDWNAAALDAVRALGTSPPAASRNLAILHAAVYDAVNGIDRTHEPYRMSGLPPASASRVAAASAAAHAVMVALYPGRQGLHDDLHGAVLSTVRDSPQKEAGIRWGESVARHILELRSTDGSGDTAPFPGGSEPGQWRPHESFGGIVRPALLPLWGSVTPFGVPDVAVFRPPPPPALESSQYADELDFVKRRGDSASAVRTPQETEVAYFWAYGAGTATPPGHWNEVAAAVSTARSLTVERNARLFALLNIALADAAIAAWDCKYAYNYWRPITAIQLADTDGNPDTAPDPEWKPLLFTPPFPEYTSGHSTFSGAAASVLAAFFGRDDVPFALGSDDLPGVTRRYGSFSEAAFESGMSRIFGGIHFMSGNLYGLSAGMAIGDFVTEELLRPKGNRSRK